MTQIIQSFSEISDHYDAAFVDLWGCVHNGIDAFPEAVAALQGFRARGGTVVLLTNAPRPRDEVAEQLAKMNVPDDAFDTIATSGDSARAAMFTGAVGSNVYHIGEQRDGRFFQPLQLISDPVTINRVPLQEADGIVCTGPFDALADPAVLRPDLLFAKQKGLKLLCANPDIVVDRGESREYCAGAVAALYTEMGGTSLYFGKPHPPVYDLARRRLAEIRPGVADNAIIAIGDGPHTDIDGAMGEDIDSLFISGGLAAQETKTSHNPDETALNHYIQSENINPSYTIGRLR
ncbi:TIGR01459 family HAD-type hydrolase [Marinovum sp. 2_MG-2023]|uniref:TIGR01459 family HAD-type hydrolase n=1 Tax=unclassified Marinovum TaxID=2647166 RepID=UPI0026E2B55B|nr:MULTISPECIES: TIGR01459 family HAD-type hydrolase [unclassified Marinovum]MDO6731784.1 TIGR01459 family HAD-type hydrolase [Marinovum sp. 2_MG-2023]MDO6781036.1 TIGR01459 family HAD-type hydrolase [Marinovum sp. 1_MG-2023]